VKTRILLEIAPRITSLLVFHSIVESLLRVDRMLVPQFYLSNGWLQLVDTFMAYVTISLAIGTVVSASPILYSLTLASNILMDYGSGFQVSIISLAGLAILLGFSSLRTGYRDGQERSIKYVDKWGFAKGLAWTIVFPTPLIIISLMLSSYSFTLIQGFVKAETPLMNLLSLNPLVKFSLIMALIIVSYKIIDNLIESAVLFIFPSRKFSLNTLTSRDDIDVLFNPSLGFIRSIILGSILSPFIYAGLDALITQALRWAGSFITIAFVRALLPYFVFFLASYIIGRAFSSLHRMNAWSTIMVVISIFTILYVSGVLYAYYYTGDFLLSLIQPDFHGLIGRIEMVFTNYYVSFFYLIDMVGNLMGFAP